MQMRGVFSHIQTVKGIDMNRIKHKQVQQSERVYMAVNVLMCFVVGCGLFFWCGKIYGASLCAM